MIKAYRFLWSALLPFAHMYINARKNRGKENQERMNERFGIASAVRPSGNIYWVHAASVGEAISACTFIERLKKTINRGDITFLLTTGTVSSADIIAKKNLEGVIHQFIPIDYERYVYDFFEYWRPKYAFIMESEIWPNLITKCNAEKMFIINGRLSDNSFKIWRHFKPILSSLLRKFDLILAQTYDDASKFSYFTGTPVECYGNIKYSTQRPVVSDDLLHKVKALMRKYVFVAASTHEGEDEIVIDAYLNIANKLGKENVSFIIIPRHPDRAFMISELMERKGLNAVLRSEITNKPCDAICVDSFGEMGTFYSITDFVCVGGSFIPIGGHNIFEPVQFNRPVMFGQYMFNFKEMSAFMKELGIGFTVNTSEEIANLFCKYINDTSFKDSIATSMQKLEQNDPADLIINRLKQLI